MSAPAAAPGGREALEDLVELRYVRGDDPLMRQVLDLCYETLHRPFDVTRNDDWGNEDPGSSHLVALVEGKVVGYGRLLVEGDWGHIRQVSVYEEWRSMGIGSWIVHALVELARAKSLRHVYLNARLTAVSLYERRGFTVVSPEPFPMPRTFLPHVRMEMDLTAPAGL
jgi:N-acetylglutamate synthase-like GNAT family acetyltransferase